MISAFTELAASPDQALLGALGAGALILAGIAVVEATAATGRRITRAISRTQTRGTSGSGRVSRA